METIAVPKRKVRFDVEGKIFEATELSVNYLMNSSLDADDNLELALSDAIGDITDEDLKKFGHETKQMIYLELLGFTFGKGITDQELTEMSEMFHMTLEEISSLEKTAITQLRGIMINRAPRNEEKEKKI